MSGWGHGTAGFLQVVMVMGEMVIEVVMEVMMMVVVKGVIGVIEVIEVMGRIG